MSFGKERLEQTGEIRKINGEVIKSRKKTNNKWFETQDSISYWGDFGQPKIVWGEISDRSKFAYDAKGGIMAEASTFFMVGNNLPYLFCVLNSPLSEWFFSKVGTTTGVGTVRWKKYTIEQLTLPVISNAQQFFFNKCVEDYVSGILPVASFTRKVNNKIYELVGLTKEEIYYIENYYSNVSSR